MKNILITTAHRGVFFAQMEEGSDLTAKMLTNLKNCRMAIYWGTTKGVQQLAMEGPNNNTRVGAMTDVDVMHDVTAVFTVTQEATRKWLDAK